MENMGISSETNSFCVYMHINKANGKKYIGITSCNPLDRWQGGLGYKHNKHFNDAINKYGWNNFDHLILYSGLTKNEACEIEQFLITKHKTQDKKYGYNIASGGQFFKHSEESKALMSENRKGKGRIKKTPEQIARMKASHSGGAAKVAVVCIETQVKYSSINEAARDTGISKKQISNCCKKTPHYNTAGHLHWEYVN